MSSSRQFSGSAGVGSGGSQAQSGMWSYAVPADEEPLGYANGHTSPVEPSSSSFSSRPRQPLSNQVNGNLRPKTRSKSKSMQGLNTDFAASGPYRPSLQGGHGDASATASDADSPWDSYKPSRVNSRGPSYDRQKVKRKGSLGAVSTLSNAAHDDPDRWIHRDKLQQIEIREMMEQGRRLDFPSRSASRTGPPSADPDAELQDEGVEEYTAKDKKRQRTFSPTLGSDELQEEDFQQAGAGQGGGSAGPNASRNAHSRRPSTSRIPVTKSSPAADEPMTGLRLEKTRTARSGSQSSQDILDSSKGRLGSPIQTNFSPTSSQGSPTKTRVASKTASAARGRNASRGGKAATGQSRPRTASSPHNGTISRPGTSSGRPPTARPEGDPPWIDTMYKPDPRLPPEEQMLPTHARRLAEKRMAFDPTVPRRRHDLMLLDDEDSPNDASGSAREEQMPGQAQSPGLQLAQDSSPERKPSPRHAPRKRDSLTSQKRNSYREDSPSVQDKRNSGQWPLRTLSFNKYAGDKPADGSSPKSETGSWGHKRPALSQTESGSYSLMPSIQTPQEMEQKLSTRSRLSNPTSTIATQDASLQQQQQQQTIRLPEEPEPTEKEQKKGCAGCCCVM